MNNVSKSQKNIFNLYNSKDKGARAHIYIYTHTYTCTLLLQGVDI